MDTRTWLQTEYPAVAEELDQFRSLPPIPPDTGSDEIVVLFDDVRLPLDLELPADFQPDLLTYYANDELIFVEAKGEVLLNRLPTAFPIAI